MQSAARVDLDGSSVKNGRRRDFAEFKFRSLHLLENCIGRAYAQMELPASRMLGMLPCVLMPTWTTGHPPA